MSEVLDSYFGECQEKIIKCTAIDEKLTLAIGFMKEALSDGAKARFRDFWRMKKVCLELFKSEIHKAKRVAYWEEYTTLLTEAHGLQRILEEQTSFQSEQITLAIEGLEKECNSKFVQSISKELKELEKIEGGKELIVLDVQSDYYQKLKEQALSFRKEILALEIRISQKNKLLSRLSKVSDMIFPMRKKILNQVTHLFSQSIDRFVHKHFNLDEKSLIGDEASYKIREEIKLFQAALRGLTLTNDAYQRIRQTLGKCWDILSKCEKERKDQFQQRKNQAPSEIEDELEALNKLQSYAQFEKSAANLVESARNKEVSKEAIFLLKKELSKRKGELESKLKAEKEFIETEVIRKAQEKEQSLVSAFDSLDTLKTKAKRMKLENIEEKLGQITSLNILNSLCGRKTVVFNYKKQIVEQILIEKREKQGVCVQELYIGLHNELKESITLLRKAKTECSLDIEFAFELNEYLEEGKLALEAIEEKF